MSAGAVASINLSRGGVPKLPVEAAAILAGGLEGDRQRDLRYPGGPDRAVSLYSADLIRRLQDEGHPIVPGAIGENLTLEGKRSLKLLLAANKRLNTAYVLKESFGSLWSYEREAWARRFFENWRSSLKWQRLEPYEKFADMIERHWDGIAAYCKPENKVSLGFVEGLNNKIRVIQRRAYGLRDQEYLRLKILTCMLPAL